MMESLVDRFNPNAIPKITLFLQFTLWITLVAIVIIFITHYLVRKYYENDCSSKIKEFSIIVLTIIVGIITVLAKICLITASIIMIMNCFI